MKRKLSAILSIILTAVISFTAVSAPVSALHSKAKPSKVKIKFVKATSKTAIKIKWKKASKAKGYQIKIATDNGFKKVKKTVTVKGGSKKTKTVKKRKAGTKYYVKVRAYVKNGSTKVYGAWSKIKTVTTKKNSATTTKATTKATTQATQQPTQPTTAQPTTATTQHTHNWILKSKGDPVKYWDNQLGPQYMCECKYQCSICGTWQVKNERVVVDQDTCQHVFNDTPDYTSPNGLYDFYYCQNGCGYTKKTEHVETPTSPTDPTDPPKPTDPSEPSTKPSEPSDTKPTKCEHTKWTETIPYVCTYSGKQAEARLNCEHAWVTDNPAPARSICYTVAWENCIINYLRNNETEKAKSEEFVGFIRNYYCKTGYTSPNNYTGPIDYYYANISVIRCQDCNKILYAKITNINYNLEDNQPDVNNNDVFYYDYMGLRITDADGKAIFDNKEHRTSVTRIYPDMNVRPSTGDPEKDAKANEYFDAMLDF